MQSTINRSIWLTASLALSMARPALAIKPATAEGSSSLNHSSRVPGVCQILARGCHSWRVERSHRAAQTSSHIREETLRRGPHETCKSLILGNRSQGNGATARHRPQTARIPSATRIRYHRPHNTNAESPSRKKLNGVSVISLRRVWKTMARSCRSVHPRAASTVS